MANMTALIIMRIQLPIAIPVVAFQGIHSITATIRGYFHFSFDEIALGQDAVQGGIQRISGGSCAEALCASDDVNPGCP